MRETTADTKVHEEGGAGADPGARTEIRLSPWCKPWGGSCAPAAHGGPQWSRGPSAAHGGPHVGTCGCWKEAVTLWGAHAGAGLMAGIDPVWNTGVCS